MTPRPFDTTPASTYGVSVDVLLDGRPHCVPVGSTLADLVAAQGQADDAVATAVDGRFVPRSQRAGCVLATGQAVLLFQPIVGG